MVEQAAVNRKVEGSSPSLGAKLFEVNAGREPVRAETSGGYFCAEQCLALRSGFSLRSKREPLPRSQIIRGLEEVLFGKTRIKS